MTDESEHLSPKVEENQEWHKPHYDFLIVGQQLQNNRIKMGTRKLNVTELSTVTVAATYREGYTSQEIIIPKVPAFVYDCCNLLITNSDKNSEVFRRPAVAKRINAFCRLQPELYVRGCSFEHAELKDEDVGLMLKNYIGHRLEPLLYYGDSILDEMETYLAQEKGIGFYVDANPEFGTLLFLFKFLHALCLRDSTQRQTPYNMAVYFTPNIIHDAKERVDAEALVKVNSKINLIANLIANSQHLSTIRDCQLVRTRSTSISSERSKKMDNKRRSFSVFGRLIRYINKEATRRIQEMERINFGVKTPDSRVSRSRSKRTPNTSVRRVDVIKSTVKLHRRLSLKDSTLCNSPTGSTLSLSPNALSRTSMLYNYFDENKKLQQFTNTSLTTLPPGAATVKKTENPSKLKLDHLDELSPDFDDSLQPKQSDFFVKSVAEMVPVVDETITPDLNRKVKEAAPDDGFKVPSFTRAKHNKINNVEETVNAKQNDSLSKSNKEQPVDENLTPDLSRRLKKTFLSDLDDGFKIPRKNSLLDFGTDMASIIMASSNADELDNNAKFTPTNRPSLALLSERKQVSRTIAEIEKRSSSEEGTNKNFLKSNDSPMQAPLSGNLILSPKGLRASSYRK